MKETNNGFYEFSQDLIIDLQNKPHKFIDLDSLINQLIDVKKANGNCKVAIATDRNLKFTYLYRVNKDGQVETDCIYSHKNETLGCTVHHVFIAEDAKYERDHEMDRYAYCSGIMTRRNTFDYVSIECIGDNGDRYEVTIVNNELIILSQNHIGRDTNMKIIETFLMDSIPYTCVENHLSEDTVSSDISAAKTNDGRYTGIDESHVNPKPVAASQSLLEAIGKR